MRYLLLLLLFYATAGQAAWKAGDSMPTPQCAPQEVLVQDTDFHRFFDLIDYSRVYGWGSHFRFAIACRDPMSANGATIYVIDPEYDAQGRIFTNYRVVRTIGAGDPARLIVERRREDETRSIVGELGNASESAVLLYLRANTQACPQNAEVMTQVLGSATLGRRAPAREPEPPRASGLCVHLPVGQGTAGGIGPANILDYERTAGGAARIVLLSDDALSQDQELLVLEHTSSGLKKVAAFKGDRFFSPRDCGSYLTGARLLRGSSKVALVYKTPKVQVVDYARPEAAPQVVYDFLRLRGAEQTAFTCEGGRASYGRERQRLWITPPQPQEKVPAKLHFLGVDADYRPMVVSAPL